MSIIGSIQIGQIFCFNYFTGYKYVIVGSLNNVKCSAGRYQPFPFWSNGTSDCILLKSACSDKGEILCGCDNTQGFAFVTTPKNPCFCNPSEEDCSCYLKQCPDKRKLSSGNDSRPMSE